MAVAYIENQLDETRNAFREFRLCNDIEKLAVVVDHEGVLLPRSFHTTLEGILSDSAVKHRVKHLPLNDPLLRVLRLIAAEPNTQFVSGSHIDAKTDIITSLPPSFEYGLSRGHKVLSGISDNFSIPQEPLEKNTTLLFFNDIPHAVDGFVDYLKKKQPHFQSFKRLDIIVPPFHDNDPGYDALIMQSIIQSLGKPVTNIQ